MWEYKKYTDYWLKKKMIYEDRAFSRKRDVDKKRIIQKHVKSNIILLIIAFIIFTIFWFFYSEKVFFIIASFLFFILGMFFLFYRKRKKALNIYRDISYLQTMDPFKFEEYITVLFNKLWYKLKTTVAEWDDWADSVWKDKDWNKLIIQTKRYSDLNLVWSPEIRDFIGSMNFYKVKKGIFLTTWYFSKPAYNTIEQVKWELDIELVNKDRLSELLNKVYNK